MILLNGTYAPAGLPSPWSRNYNLFKTLFSFPFLDYSEDKVIIAPWKAFQIIWRGVPCTGFVSMTASWSCAIETIYKNNQTNDLILIGNNAVLQYQACHSLHPQDEIPPWKTAYKNRVTRKHAEVFKWMQHPGGWKQGISKLTKV